LEKERNLVPNQEQQPMKGNMKSIIGKAMSVIICSSSFVIMAQNQPYLRIKKDSPTSAQVSWTNTVGTSYRVWSTPDLTKPFSLWSPLEDAFSDDTNIQVSISTTESTARFFRVSIPTNGTLPAVQIFSPTNNQTVSGTIAVGVGAQITNQLQGVNLYLDDALVGFIDSGGVRFDLDTSHFANGSHTLYVAAVDTANNEVSSSTITLDFENSVRWLDADSLFQSFVPVSVVSDIYPADWIVSVSDTNGVTIRTFSGTTSDGIIQTSWDGTADNSVAVSDEAVYKVTIAVTSQNSGSFSMMSSSSTMESSDISSTSDVETLDPTAAYFQMLENYSNAPDNIKMIYPPLPPPPSLISTTRSTATAMREMSPMTSSSSGSSGSSSTTVWREAAWNSGEIILSRQKITGMAGLFFDGAVGNLLVDIRNLITTAQDSVNGDRGTYQNAILLMQQNGDFSSITNALKSANPNTREFYFYGHGGIDGNSIGFRDGTPNDGIKVSDLKPLLRNYDSSAAGNSPQKIITHKPFDFVFLDGCMTAVGSFPEAFGIPKTLTSRYYLTNNKHKRAFMGWDGKLSLSILDTESINWSLAFWNSWLGDPTSTTVEQAVTEAFHEHPGAASHAVLQIYGYTGLTWSE
jgi:hypothetical protein